MRPALERGQGWREGRRLYLMKQVSPEQGFLFYRGPMTAGLGDRAGPFPRPGIRTLTPFIFRRRNTGGRNVSS